MSLSNTVVAQTYNGNGSLDTFAIPFTYFDSTQVKVYLIDTTTNPDTETLQTITSDYTIVGSNVVMVTPPSATEQLRVERVTPLTQIIDYITNGPFPAESHEQGLDRIVMMIQELDRRITALEA
jgi:hypothetical protein